jgi:cbb3-type cytochrome oxidase subunit 1
MEPAVREAPVSFAATVGEAAVGMPAAAPVVEARLVMAHGLAALAALLVSVSFGVLIAVQLLFPDLTGSVPWLTWGRVRYAHTQGILFGWLANAFFAFLYHAVPLLSGRPVTSPRLGRWLFGLWNFAMLVPGWILVLAGVSQPLEWAEFPLVVDAMVMVVLALAIVQFLPPFFRRGVEYLYVSSWYIIGGLVFTLLAYPMGNLAPEWMPGAQGAAFSGLWIHDAIGLFVTPLALASIYFVIPAVTRRPIYSHFLSMLGFWVLFFVYPLNGTHHYVFSVIPMEAQIAAIAASTLLGFSVLIVVGNLLFSLRGAGAVPRDAGLRFVALATIFYLVVALQGALQAQMAVNESVHFSDWVVGHSHLAMAGFATFAAIGGLVHAWQRIPAARYNARALDYAFWLFTGGLVVMFLDLTIAGLVQAQLWHADVPWLDSVRASRPYWMVRALAAIPMVAGLIALGMGFTTGPSGGGLPTLNPGEDLEPPDAIAPRLATPATEAV